MIDARISLEGFDLGVHGFTTTRHHGVSQEPFNSLNLGDHVGDEPHHVRANRQRLNQLLPSPPVWVRQVHGTHVLIADQWDGSSICQADAIVTQQPGQVLGMLTADCMPVVIADQQGQVLGLAHAGWRGLAAGVLGNTVDAMHQYQSASQHWHAWIGPCIGPQAFEVGSDVRDAFMMIDPAYAAHFVPHIAPHKWLADLPAIATDILMGLGIMSVNWCGLCTATDEQRLFYSHRREGRTGPTGRMATVAWLSAKT